MAHSHGHSHDGWGGHSHGHSHDHAHGSSGIYSAGRPAAAAIPVNAATGQPMPAPQQIPISEMSPVQLTQRGYLQALQERVEQNKFDVNEADTEGITCMHWAAINNRIAIVKYFIDQGANVDAVGGEIKATPLHWAVRQGHMPMITLLIQNGADPNISDSQGFNCLHVAAQFGFANVCAYLIARGVPVDCIDHEGRTPLMWAAAKAFSPDVTRILITLKAGVNIQDKSHNTALHYAVSNLNAVAARILIDSGASTAIKNHKEMTATDLAHRVTDMEKRGIDVSPRIHQLRHLLPSPKVKSRRDMEEKIARDPLRRYVLIALPFCGLGATGISFTMMANGNWWGVALLIAAIWTWTATASFFSRNYRFGANPTPMAVYVGTKALFFITFVHLYYPLVIYERIIPPWMHVLIWVSITLLTYNFYKAKTSNPGYINRGADPHQVIIDMAEKNLLSGSQFCNSCVLRKPIRSKHCSTCDRCVARFDHHCPFVDNCVGVGNHKYFMNFLYFFVLVNYLFLYTTIQYLLWYSSDTHGFFPTLWAWVSTCPWATFMLAQGCVHSTWVTLLLGAQLKQTMIDGVTTNEAINKWKYDYMQGRGRSPWHMGYWRNLMELYRPSIDWFHTYEPPSRPHAV